MLALLSLQFIPVVLWGWKESCWPCCLFSLYQLCCEVGRRVVGLVVSSVYISCVVRLEGELLALLSLQFIPVVLWGWKESCWPCCLFSLYQLCCGVGRRVVGLVVSSVYVSCVVRWGGELLALLSLQFIPVVLWGWKESCWPCCLFSLYQLCCEVGRRVVGLVVSSVYISCVVRLEGELLALLSLQFIPVVLWGWKESCWPCCLFSLSQLCCGVGRRVVGLVVSSVYISCVVGLEGELLALLSLQFIPVVL